MPVRIGLGLSNFEFSGPDAFWRWIALCEAGGVDSIWQSDSLVSKMPFLECMSVMAALAGATKRLKFGMGVLALGLRDPFLVARQCATIDYLSKGRLLPAFGIGALAMPDWSTLGIPNKDQGSRMDEAIEIMARLWRGEAVDFEGRHFQYKDATIAPLPAQQPLPLWLGGASQAAIRRTGRFGTGWLAGFESPEEIGPIVAAINQCAQESGRTIDPEHFGAGFFFHISHGIGESGEPLRERLRRRFNGRNLDHIVVQGDAARVIARIAEYRAAGITKFVLRPLGADDDEICAQTRRMIDEVIPAVA